MELGVSLVSWIQAMRICFEWRRAESSEWDVLMLLMFSWRMEFGWLREGGLGALTGGGTRGVGGGEGRGEEGGVKKSDDDDEEEEEDEKEV